MRILQVISTIDPACGGPPVIVTRLAAAQAALGHEVHLLTYDSPESRAYWEQSREVLPGGDDVEAHFIEMDGSRERIFAGNARKAVRNLVDEIDVMHLHNVWESILRVAANEARAADIPYTILLNGMLDEHSMGNKSLKKKLALTFGYRAMFDGASALHMGNADEQRLIEPLGLKPPPLIVPNGISFEEIDPLPEKGAFRAAHPELGDAPYILFLSRLQYKKGLDYLAEAFRIYAAREPEAHLVVAGPDEGMQADFEERITRAELNERVHVVGPVYGREKYAAFNDAACFCLPTRQEGFTVVVNETLACGVPMVITEGAHRPDVGEAEAGVIVPLDEQAVADALLELMDDPDRRARLGANGRSHAERNLTWDSVARTMLEAYESFQE